MRQASQAPGRPSPWRALRTVLPNAGLRNVLVAEATVSAGTGMTLVALTVFAFEVGGPSLLGLALSLRYLGVGLVRPVVGVALDQMSPLRGVRTGSSLAFTGALVSVVGGVLGETAGVALVIAGICTLKLGHSIAKAGRRAAVAVSAESPAQATATIGLLSLAGAISGLLGPTMAAALLLSADVLGVLVVSAALYLVASVMMWNLPVSRERPQSDATFGHVLSGQKETLKAPAVVWTFVLLGTSSFVNAATGVFYAPLAIESLGAGEAGVGYLRSGFGVGSMAMSLALLSAVGSSNPGRRLAFGVALWGTMIALAEPTGVLWLALIPMLGMGASKTLIDTAYLTRLQRTLADSLHQRVLGLGETVNFAAGALGALIVIPMLNTFELGAAMAIVGSTGVVIAAVVGLRLQTLGATTSAPGEALELIRRTETFGFLPPIELDLLALRMRSRALEADETLDRQGDEGRSWFIIAEGEMGVWVDDAHVTNMGPGESFGEIALLHACPRTATITAAEPSIVHELDSTVFLRALGVADGHAFDSIVEERLARSAPADFSLRDESTA